MYRKVQKLLTPLLKCRKQRERGRNDKQDNFSSRARLTDVFNIQSGSYTVPNRWYICQDGKFGHNLKEHERIGSRQH
jgi:hypothetical protein